MARCRTPARPAWDWERELRERWVAARSPRLPASEIAWNIVGLATIVLLFGGTFGRTAEEIFIVVLAGGLAFGAVVNRL